MLEEPVFLINEYLEKGQEDLQKVIKSLKKKPVNYESKAKFLRDFTNAMFKSYVDNYSSNAKHNREEELKIDLKRELEIKRRELMEKLSQMKVKRVKEQHAEMQKKEVPAAVKKESLHKDLILSKITNKVLASRDVIDHTYQLAEPFLKDEEREIFKALKTENVAEEGIKAGLEKRKVYSEDFFERVRYYILRDSNSFGQLAPIMEEEGLLQVVCNGPGEHLTISLSHSDNLQSNILYGTMEELNEQIKILAKKAKVEISEDNPFLDATLDNGFSVQANLGTEFSRPRFVIHK